LCYSSTHLILHVNTLVLLAQTQLDRLQLHNLKVNFENGTITYVTHTWETVYWLS
jgi:hypothetical protein